MIRDDGKKRLEDFGFKPHEDWRSGIATANDQLRYVFANLQSHDWLEFDPHDQFLLDLPTEFGAFKHTGVVWENLSPDITVNFNNVPFFCTTKPIGRAFVVNRTNRLRWINGPRCFGYGRTPTIGGTGGLSVSGTGATQDANNAYLTAIADAAYDDYTQVLVPGRDKDGFWNFDASVKCSQAVNGDVLFEVVDAETGSILYQRAFTVAADAAFHTINISFRPHMLDNRIYPRIRKGTGNANTITVANVATFNRSDSSGGADANIPIWVRHAYGFYCQGLWAETWIYGLLIGDGNANLGGLQPYGVTIDDFFSHAAGQMGMAITRGTKLALRRGLISWPHQDGVDIEPNGSGNSANEVLLQDLEVVSPGIYGFVCGPWHRCNDLRVRNFKVDKLHMPNYAGWWGGAVNGHVVGLMVRNSPATQDVEVAGINMVMQDVFCEKGIRLHNDTSDGFTPSHMYVEGRTPASSPSIVIDSGVSPSGIDLVTV